MQMRFFSPLLSLLCALATAISAAGMRPNIVFILADDLGYGDVSCLNPESKIQTPHMDRLAREGMIFTDAHSSSAVCTPTRYNILTGRYNWRSKLQKGVLLGYGKPLIAPDLLTVPAFLGQHGYTTACFGKWHLGMDIPEGLNFSDPIRNGPTTRGFDEFFGISASLDMPPYAFIRNNAFTQPLDTEKTLWRNRLGPAASDFEADLVLPTLTRKAVEFIEAKGPGEAPFFLYLPLASPHTPVAPSEKWKGRSGIGDYGDFVMETDGTVGAVLDALEKAGVREKTLVIVTSDNGFAPAAGTKALEDIGHFPSAGFRGYKSDLWEGGHRIPFIASWPGTIAAGSRSPALVLLGDLMATCADVLGENLPENAGVDSISILPALKGSGGLRNSIVHHSISGRFAIRKKQWKLVLCPGSGGWSPAPKPAQGKPLPPVQLYNLESDRGETRNLAEEHPEKVQELRKLLADQIKEGRSTPGPRQENDATIVVDKS